MAAVSFRNIEKTYGGKTKVIHGIGFDIADGEFVVLVGPSGCGKSTLLGIVGGLDRACAGAVSMDGAAPADLGFMFQEPRLMPWMSVLDNVLLVVPDDGSMPAAPSSSHD